MRVKKAKITNAPETVGSYEETLEEWLKLPDLYTVAEQTNWFRILKDDYKKRIKLAADPSAYEQQLINNLEFLMRESPSSAIVLENGSEATFDPLCFESLGFELANSGRNQKISWIRRQLSVISKLCIANRIAIPDSLIRHQALTHLAKGVANARFIAWLKSKRIPTTTDRVRKLNTQSPLTINDISDYPEGIKKLLVKVELVDDEGRWYVTGKKGSKEITKLRAVVKAIQKTDFVKKTFSLSQIMKAFGNEIGLPTIKYKNNGKDFDTFVGRIKGHLGPILRAAKK